MGLLVDRLDNRGIYCLLGEYQAYSKAGEGGYIQGVSTIMGFAKNALINY